VWGVSPPVKQGRDGSAILDAAASGDLKALVVGGVEIADLPDPARARQALGAAEFVVSLELRASEVTAQADVVFPIAPVAEKAGTFIDWEGRPRPFEVVLAGTNALPDVRVLAGVAEELGVPFGIRTPAQAASELADLGSWDGDRLPAPSIEPGSPAAAGEGRQVLATWRLLIDDGRMLAGEPFLAATGRKPIALVSAGTAARLRLAVGDGVTLATETGSVTLPMSVADVSDGVVWAPQHVVHRELGARAGSLVTVTGGAG
jgi:NADH-quinone oxidoreductase subunit G